MTTEASPDNATRRGVLLFNLGGPETLTDVRPFLYNLFSDPDIIRIRNDALRKTVALLIAWTRQFKSRRLYAQIGGGSPLRRITDEQAAALAGRLAARGSPARVYVGMRCWKPTIDEALARIQNDRITDLVVLPLFPQFSVTTTGSCTNHLRLLLAAAGESRPERIAYVDAWYEEPRYVEAMADSIREAMARFSDPDPATIHVIYSAHSIPSRYVDEGDPYLEQTQKTVELIDRQLGTPSPSTLAFQSKVGPVRWLEPATPHVLDRMAREGVRKVLMVPVSFVSDHIETLQEIDILYHDQAKSAGIGEFQRAESMNLRPKFIESLAEISLRRFAELSRGAPTVSRNQAP